MQVQTPMRKCSSEARVKPTREDGHRGRHDDHEIQQYCVDHVKKFKNVSLKKSQCKRGKFFAKKDRTFLS